MILHYISTRFRPLKFVIFAILLVMLGVTARPEWTMIMENFLFVFASLFAFRLLDDAWSFHLDRIDHPQRTYATPDNFQRFLLITGLVLMIYLLGLFWFSGILAFTIFILLLVSNVLYLMYFKVRGVMQIIPLLKYPVFIWYMLQFSMSTEVLTLSAGAFFMMLTSDYLDEKKERFSELTTKIPLVLITGVLIFQPWTNASELITDLVLVTISFMLIAWPSGKGASVFAIVIYPVLHIFDLIIQL